MIRGIGILHVMADLGKDFGERKVIEQVNTEVAHPDGLHLMKHRFEVCPS